MTQTYQPQRYWEERLTKTFDLTGVGHRGLGVQYNRYLYKRRLETLTAGLGKTGCTLDGKSILEIGCGTGFYTKYFTKQNIMKYTGIDITRISVANLKKQYPSYNFICADIAQFGLSKLHERFDIVFAADVLFHIVEERSFQNAVQNMIELLKPDGLFIVSDVFPENTVSTSAHVCLRSFSHYEQTLGVLQVHRIHIEPIFAILQPPPVKTPTFWWNLYANIWRIERRVVRLNIIDQTLPIILEWLDRVFFCPRYGLVLPNSKWLFARKHEKNTWS
ncbi:class I SAM-dependent methyltransferase [Chloroflexus sp.]|uniref:class I SAM-dependent methyltransferase n=1 Tax=Chloroflexus sp. TaxID=1904827 RepID=UPI003D14EB15